MAGLDPDSVAGRDGKVLMRRAEVTDCGDNVFADLNVSNADEELLRAQLTYRVRTEIEERGPSASEVAGLLGIHQPQAAMLVRNHLGSLPVARLMRFLAALGYDVQITTQPKART